LAAPTGFPPSPEDAAREQVGKEGAGLARGREQINEQRPWPDSLP